MPVALYGVEIASPKEKKLVAFTSAILDCIAGKTKPRDLDAVFNRMAINGNDLDPVCQIFTRRVMAMRRAIAKRPGNKEKIRRLLEKYNIGRCPEESSDDEEVQCELAEGTGPAPHPMQ